MTGATAGTSVRVSIPELKIDVRVTTDADGRAAISAVSRGLQVWSPETPKLYKVEMVSGTYNLRDEIGFRTLEIKGSEILLNAKPVFLHGISIHAEAPYRTGRAYSEADVYTLLGWAKELGCNFVRLAHYPKDERMTRAADRIGILV